MSRFSFWQFLIKLVIFLTLLNCIGWGVFLIQTQMSSAPVAAIETKKESPIPVPMQPQTGKLQVLVESPIPPSSIQIKKDGKVFFERHEPGPSFTIEKKDFLYLPEGCEFQVHAEWPQFLNGPRAIRFKAQFEDAALAPFILWGENQEVQGVWSLPALEVQP